jgi:hypothetical protein
MRSSIANNRVASFGGIHLPASVQSAMLNGTSSPQSTFPFEKSLSSVYPNLQTVVASAPYASSYYSASAPYAPMMNSYNYDASQNVLSMCAGTCERSQKIIVCYTPTAIDATNVSCLKSVDSPKAVLTTDSNLATVPTNAIIDTVEFFGINNFSTKDVYSIGLGQLNQGITFPLIDDADADTANEKVGGCRSFFSDRTDGRTEKNIVLYQSNVNVILNQPIVSGGLQVVIYYHLKII